MGWTYLADTVGSQKHSAELSDLSPIVRSSPTLEAFFSHGWKRETYPSHRSGTTLQHSTESNSEGKLTLFTEDFPAKTLAVQDVEQVWKESEAVFSSKCVVWSKKSNPDSSFWKTSRPYAHEDLLKSPSHWQLWGMICDGLVYLPQALEPATLEKGGSYWQTPKSMMIDEDYENYLSRVKRSQDPKTNTKTRPNSLAIQVKTPQFWPTPTKEDYRRRGPNSKQQGLPEKIGNVGGQLNPDWVEWLMGLPTGWTRLTGNLSQTYHESRKRKRTGEKG